MENRGEIVFQGEVYEKKMMQKKIYYVTFSNEGELNQYKDNELIDTIWLSIESKCLSKSKTNFEIVADGGKKLSLHVDFGVE